MMFVPKYISPKFKAAANVVQTSSLLFRRFPTCEPFLFPDSEIHRSLLKNCDRSVVGAADAMTKHVNFSFLGRDRKGDIPSSISAPPQPKCRSSSAISKEKMERGHSCARVVTIALLTLHSAL
jgi:hypothetical protein